MISYRMTSDDYAIKANLKAKLEQHFVGKAVRVKWNNGRYLVFVEGYDPMISHEDHDDTHIFIPYEFGKNDVILTLPRERAK